MIGVALVTFAFVANWNWNLQFLALWVACSCFIFPLLLLETLECGARIISSQFVFALKRWKGRLFLGILISTFLCSMLLFWRYIPRIGILPWSSMFTVSWPNATTTVYATLITPSSCSVQGFFHGNNFNNETVHFTRRFEYQVPFVVNESQPFLLHGCEFSCGKRGIFPVARCGDITFPNNTVSSTSSPLAWPWLLGWIIELVCFWNCVLRHNTSNEQERGYHDYIRILEWEQAPTRTST